MARPFSGPTAYRQTTGVSTGGAAGGQGWPSGALQYPLVTSALASSAVSNRRKKTTVRSFRWQVAALSVAVQLARKSFGRWSMIVAAGRANMKWAIRTAAPTMPTAVATMAARWRNRLRAFLHD